ncbi:hypothetical protein CR970_01030 [Candidatus Saccharibacteria bacterium]|nr:MAG: hypothetical protein CR970_01030 [Candidatus Saccharibacteria bacterium]
MFDDFIVQPIFNLLVAIYALLPGHDFGLAIILFTIVIRILIWPLAKRQLHQTKLMRKMQPEIKRIKEAAGGDRQKESMLLMELYKERGVNVFRSIGTLIVQFVVLIGLYMGLRNMIDDPRAILENSYVWIRNLEWMRVLQGDIGQFQQNLGGMVDLSRAAISKDGGFYLPAMILVIGSATMQYFQSMQLMPRDKERRGIRQIMREAGEGKAADQAELSAAISGVIPYFIPVMVLMFTVSLPAALSLYWMVGGMVAYVQQARILREDEEEMESLADKPAVKKTKTAAGSRVVIEGEVVSEQPAAKTKKTAKSKTKTSGKRKHRRK